MQPNTSSPHNMKLTKPDIPTGPVKRQVAEAWNRQRNKKSRGAVELEIERQYKDIKTPGTCQCCEHYGQPCLQEDASLMTAEARQCYYLDINKDLSTQETFQEGVTQYQDGTQTMNLEDWSISFKEFQPSRIKQRKKQASEESQEKMELPEPLVHSSTQPCSNQLQPKVVQPPHDNSIKKNPDAQIASRRAMVEQKGSPNGYVKGVCFKCGEEGHYVNKCANKA